MATNNQTKGFYEAIGFSRYSHRGLQGNGMKKLALVLGALTLAAAAQAAPLCTVYEFAELQTYSLKELTAAADEASGKAMQNYLNEREAAACNDQVNRIDRVLRMNHGTSYREINIKRRAAEVKP